MLAKKVRVIPEATACGVSLGWLINEYDKDGEHVRSRGAVYGPRPGREPSRTHPSLEWYLHPVREAVYAYEKFCRKPVNHNKGHGSVRRPIVGAPRRVVHEERFKPNTIPGGVDLSITMPHDCANHLKDVEEVARGY